MTQPVSLAVATDESGFTLIEALVVMLIMGILMAIAIPTFLGAQHNGDNGAAQQNLKAALVAVGNVDNQTQTYGLIAYSSPTTETATTGACSLTTTAAKDLKGYDKTAVFSCAAPTTYKAHEVSFRAGKLPSTAGGWIGLATKSQSGRCYQLYISANGRPIYGSTTATCADPTYKSHPTKTTWS